jgi:hypothetical protein
MWSEAGLTTEGTENTEEITESNEPQMGHRWTQIKSQKT